MVRPLWPLPASNPTANQTQMHQPVAAACKSSSRSQCRVPRVLPHPWAHLQARQGVSQQPAALLLVLQVAAPQGRQLAAQLAAPQLPLIELGPAGRAGTGRQGECKEDGQAPERIRRAGREGR